MSLRVWLPLNGNLNNQGLSDVTVTNNDATVNVNGKIGSCYEFNNSKNISLTDYVTEFLTYTDWSISLWFKCTAQNTTHTGSALISSGNWNYPTQLLQFSLGYFSSDHYTKLLITNANSWSDGYSYNFYLNTWYHVVLVSGNNKMSAYVNGELIGNSFSAYTPVSSAQSDVGIGKATYYNGMSFFGLMNDVRIYDHALSVKEVKELSKGLVLHYKLDDAYSEATTNLCSQLVQGGQMTLANNILTHNGTNSDTYWYIKPKEALIGGATYTVSCYLSGFTLDTDWIQWGVGAQSGDNNAGHWKTYNGYNSFTFTMPAGKDGSTANFIFDDSNAGSGRSQIFTISNVQLELKDHATPFVEYGQSRSAGIIYDSSGYSNNIISNGSKEITILSNSVRFENYSNFVAGARMATPVSGSTFLPKDAISVSIWFKSSNAINRFLSCTESGGFNFESSNGYVSAPLYIKGKGYIHVNSSTTTWSSLSDNEWHMVAFTYDRSNFKLYIDGQLDTTVASSYPNIDIAYGGSTPFTLGAEAQTIVSPIAGTYVGGLSDCRIYATALSDNDILELYNNPLNIDKDNNIYSLEYKEAGSNELLQGANLTTPYSYHNKTKPYFGELTLTGTGTSISSDYISISPTGKTYYYDITVSITANNQFYLGFARFDINKTSRSNEACVYVIATKPTTDIVKQRYKGTVDLSTDGVNPAAFIALRILNGWSSTTGTAIIHHMSLREVSTFQQPSIEETGTFIIDELKEYNQASFYKNCIVEGAEIIEK